MRADFVSRIRPKIIQDETKNSSELTVEAGSLSDPELAAADKDQPEAYFTGTEASDDESASDGYESDSSLDSDIDKNQGDDGSEVRQSDIPDNMGAFKKLQTMDEDISPIIERLQNINASGEEPSKLDKDYFIQDGILYRIATPYKNDREYRLQLVVPKICVKTILKMLHDDLGHLGIDKTHDKIRRRYYWNNSFRDVAQYIGNCMICNQRRMKELRLPMQRMQIPNAPFQSIAIDLAGPYPQTENGSRYILTIICLFSGWPEAFVIPNKEANTVARVIMEEFIPRHACPESMTSDNGTEFVNNIIKIMSEKLGILRIKTSIYHPESNGKCERLHRVLNDIIAKRVASHQMDWPAHVPAALWAIRTSVHESAKYSPYFLVYGRDPKLPVDLLFRPKFKYHGEEYVPLMLERIHFAFLDVKRNLRRSQERNQHYRPGEMPVLAVGDAVYYHSKELGPNLSRKLAKSWQPHFRIIEAKANYNYVIKHIPSGTVKTVHAKLLRKAEGDENWDREFTSPEDIITHNEQSRIKECRMVIEDRVEGERNIIPAPARRQPIRACRLSTPLTTPQRVTAKRGADSEEITESKRQRIAALRPNQHWFAGWLDWMRYAKKS